MGKKLRFFFGALAGALVQYLLDPEAGKSRRARAGVQARTYIRDIRQGIDRRRVQLDGKPADGSSLGNWRTARIHVSSEQPFSIDEAPRIV